MTAKLFIDGASRGNPGPSGYGFVLYLEDKVFTGYGYIGIKTNNYAEYMALIHGLKSALSLGVDEIIIYSDSELVVKQMNGTYRVRNKILKELYANAIKLLKNFRSYKIFHISRDKNKEADKLANKAIDVAEAGGWAVAAGVDPVEESPGPIGQGAG